MIFLGMAAPDGVTAADSGLLRACRALAMTLHSELGRHRETATRAVTMAAVATPVRRFGREAA
jgi:hypothetical protein